jgi:hypothetical protein
MQEVIVVRKQGTMTPEKKTTWWRSTQSLLRRKVHHQIVLEESVKNTTPVSKLIACLIHRLIN